MACTIFMGVCLATLIAVLIATFHGSQSLKVLGWTTFTGFPLLVVIVIATLARLQHQINVRSPPGREEQASKRELDLQ